jgi:hypothetical protein
VGSLTATAVGDRAGERGELSAAVAAVRSRVGLVVLLLALAAAAWCSTVERMAGMDGDPASISARSAGSWACGW